MRAVVEHYEEADDLPEINVYVVCGKEDICIKVRNSIERVLYLDNCIQLRIPVLV